MCVDAKRHPDVSGHEFSLPKTDKLFHLVGIGGSGMSGLAQCLVDLGYKVSGSETQPGITTERLAGRGVLIYPTHQPNNISDDVSLVIKSAAIRDDNPELIRARERGLPVIKYAQALGKLMHGKYGIAVSGSHGKTTTSALLVYLLTCAGQKPSYVIGGHVPDLTGNGRIDQGRYFVAEACEYDRSFHNLNYAIGIINNLEPDHLDYYQNLDALIEAFAVFAEKIPPEGYLVANADDPNVVKCLNSARSRVIKFGQHSTTEAWRITSVATNQDGHTTFKVAYRGCPYDEFTLRIPGRHNVTNALVVVIVSELLGLPRPVVKQVLADFRGVARRFELVGRVNNITVLDDYAHHPTELQATIRTAGEIYPNHRIWHVFQPHQYHRTRLFLNEFADTFAPLERVIITDIYLARDTAEEQRKVSAPDLVKKINQLGGQAQYLSTPGEIIKYLCRNILPGDVIITMGAGNIYQVAKEILAELSK